MPLKKRRKTKRIAATLTLPQRSAIDALVRVDDQLRRTALNTKESERLSAELELISERVRSREYKRARFVNNVLNIPDRNQELLDDLAFLTSLGMIWKRILLRARLPVRASVLDLGVGPFPKIELGLYYTGFEGRVVMLDQAPGVARNAQSFLRFFNPGFTASPKSGDLWRASPGRFDAVVANHLIDDLVLAAFCRRHKLSASRAYSSEREFISIWSRIMLDEDSAQRIIVELAKRLDKLVRPRGAIVLLDYESHSHRALKLGAVAQFAIELHATLQRELRSAGFVVTRNRNSPLFRHDKVALRHASLLVARRGDPL